MKKQKFKNRYGLTLMELLLSVALLAVLASATFSVIYWQNRTYTHIESKSQSMAKLMNTYLLMYKNIRGWNKSLYSDVSGTYVSRTPAGIRDFSYNSSTKQLLWRNEPILNNASATMRWDPTKKLVTVALQVNDYEGTALKFVVFPRNGS